MKLKVFEGEIAVAIILVVPYLVCKVLFGW